MSTYAALSKTSLTGASPDLLRELLSMFIDASVSAEADVLCGADYGQRSGERIDTRHGYRHRGFDTRVGTLDVSIPPLQQGSYFPDWLSQRRKRAERALTTVVATCYLLGASTRRMEKLVDTPRDHVFVEVAGQRHGERVGRAGRSLRSRPLDAGPYTFVAADAMVLEVRENGRVVNVHTLVAVGVNADGYREILGVEVTSTEDGAGRLSFSADWSPRACPGCSW